MLHARLLFLLVLLTICFSRPSFSQQTKKTVTRTVPSGTKGAGGSFQNLDERAEALLGKMTLKEKVGQMTQITLDVIGKGNNIYAADEPFTLDPQKLRKAVVDYGVGSILNTSNNKARTRSFWQQLVSDLQKTALTESRIQIPILYGVDAIHGPTYTVDGTFFPQQIAQAATRNRALVRRGAEISAYETRASALPWTFAPVLDLGSDPRSPRQWETFGEDPYLIAELGSAAIKGYEGTDNDVGNPVHVASCMKHFLGYQVPVSGKDRTNAYIPAEALHEYHLAPFKAAVKAGAQTIMINSGLVNGVPMHANKDVLTGTLKEQLGFQGLVVTDWGDIENLYRRDHYASSDKDAIRLAINAGIDMSMVPYQYETFCNGLVELVNEGSVSMARIDDAVRRILKLKLKLGLFERPVTYAKDYPEFGTKAAEQASYATAAEAITLLKNEAGVLPLAKTNRVLVAGPNANSMRTLNGAWSYSWQGDKVEAFASRYQTILEAIQAEIGTERVTYVPGVSYKMDGKYFEEYADRMQEAVTAASRADAIVLCLGENTYVEKPGDLNDLNLSQLQIQLAQRLAATGKPVILVLNEGRPRIISAIEPGMKAVVQVYLPSNFGGDALADILFGDVNPSGKLPYTYPRYANALTSYIHKYSDEQKKAEGAYDYEADFNPQYLFGHGLSYTSFSYENLRVTKTRLPKKDSVQIEVDVTNTGKREGKEVVHLFSSDLYASRIAPDVKRLRGFEKINLKPGEKATVRFTVKATDLAYAGPDGQPVLEAGEIRLSIAELSQSVFIVD